MLTNTTILTCDMITLLLWRPEVHWWREHSPGMFCILYSSFWLDSHFCEFWLTESYKSVCSHCIVEKNYTTITILGAVGFFGEQLPPRYSFIHYCDNVPNVASQCVLATRISPVSFQFVWSCSISHTSLTGEQYCCTLGAGAPAWL